MERLLQDVQGNNTSGRLNWRIDNTTQRMEEARTGTIPALYSQPFFTTDAGKEYLPNRNVATDIVCIFHSQGRGQLWWFGVMILYVRWVKRTWLQAKY